MRFREFSAILTESTGLAGRKAGDEFVPTEGKGPTLYFDELVFFPDGGGKYETQDELVAAVEEYTSQYGEPTWSNQQRGARAFGIVSFTDDEGNTHHYGRFFREIKTEFRANSWQNKDLPGYTLNTLGARKEKAGLQPTDILTQFENLSSQDLINQITAKFGARHPLTQVTKLVEAGTSFPIEFPAVPEMDLNSFSNYFCELLHPLALQSGTYSGDVNTAAEMFLSQPNFDNTTITFDTSKTAGLHDSLLTAPDGGVIRLSSKAGAGASASTANLLTSIEEIKKTGNTKLLKQLKETFDIINIINTYNNEEAAIQLALKYDIIDNEEARQIHNVLLKSNRNVQDISYYDIQNNPEEYLSKKLGKIYTSKRTTKPDQATAGNHIITCIMYLACDHINTKTSFPKQAVTLLANAGLVQIHSYVKQTKDKWRITEFKAQYPGNYDVRVYLDGAKYYASTKLKGKVPFMIKPESYTVRKFYVNHTDKMAAKAEKQKAATAKKKSMTAANPTGKKTAKKGPAGRAKQ